MPPQTDSLRFERAALRATAGRASIEMGNPSDIPHAIGIRGKGVDEVGATVGRDGSSRVTPDLRPGVYQLFCYLHPMTMHQELTVRPDDAVSSRPDEGEEAVGSVDEPY